jgi:uncharacterized protein (TIGR03000 family)
MGYQGCADYHGYRIYSVLHHCHGCYGCSTCYGCYSSGGAYYSSCSSCYGTCGCCCGGVIYGSPPVVVPVPMKETLPTPKKATAPTTSRVIVQLPVDAKLWVDNVECPLTSAVRSFDTPALDPSQKYTYNLKMQVVRDGRTVTHTHRAVITPGQPVQVDFNAGALSTASRE